MNPEFELITHVLCPYVQRSVIVLKEKGIAYHRTDIDLDNKPDWFHRLSPLGKVPVLVTGESRSLFESAVICEYLNDITPGSLHPGDALERAEHRAWIEFGSGLLNRIAQLYNSPSETAYESTLEALRTQFRQLETRLESGPYFSGADFCIIDAVYGPIFRYFEVFESVMVLDVFQGVDKVLAWREQLTARTSVQQAVTHDYPERLIDFVRARNSYMSTLMARSVA